MQKTPASAPHETPTPSVFETSFTAIHKQIVQISQDTERFWKQMDNMRETVTFGKFDPILRDLIEMRLLLGFARDIGIPEELAQKYCESIYITPKAKKGKITGTATASGEETE